MEPAQEVLGIDIGMVLMGERNMAVSVGDQGFSAAYLARKEVPGAIDAVARLSHERFSGRVRVVSKRNRQTQPLAIRWLVERHFFARVGIGIDDVHFCLTREGKAPICRDLGVTHFVDNLLEVHSYLTTVPNRYLINADDEEVERFADYLPDVTRVATWQEILDSLL